MPITANKSCKGCIELYCPGERLSNGKKSCKIKFKRCPNCKGSGKELCCDYNVGGDLDMIYETCLNCNGAGIVPDLD